MNINARNDPFFTHGSRPEGDLPLKTDVTAVTSPDHLAEILRWRQLVTACKRTDGIIALRTRGCLGDLDPSSAAGPLWKLDEATLLVQPLSAGYGRTCDRDGVTIPAALAWNHFTSPGGALVEDLLAPLGESLFTTAGNPAGAWLPMAVNLDREGIRQTLDFLVGPNGERAEEPVSGSTSWDTLTRADGISLLAWAYRGTKHDFSTLARKKNLPVFVMHRFDPASFVDPLEKGLDFLEVLAHHPSFPAIMDCKVSRNVQGDSFLDTLEPPQPLSCPIRQWMGDLAGKIAGRIHDGAGTANEMNELRNRLLALYQRMIVHCPEFAAKLVHISQWSLGSEKWGQTLTRLGFDGTEGFLNWMEEVRVRGKVTKAVTPVLDETFSEPML
jgi:hypothetical protein